MTNDDMPSLSDMLKQHNQEQKEAEIQKFLDATDRSREQGSRSGRMSEEEKQQAADYLREGGRERLSKQVQDLQSARAVAAQEKKMLQEHQEKLNVVYIEEEGGYFRNGRECDEYGNYK